MTIFINLENPVVEAAHKGKSVEDISFRRLSYEIAFSEYAFAVAYEQLEEDPGMPGEDAVYEVRDTLNRISKSAVDLYRDILPRTLR